jgi:XTP/dITP diphosphohydrolase
MHILRLATTNQGKIKELEQMLALYPIQVRGLGDLSGFSVEEDGVTFQQNAAKKALACFNLTQEPSLADDSGLLVTALNGAPGVRSARYTPCQPGISQDASNRKHLLENLKEVSDRSAFFVCCLAYCTSPNTCVFFEKTLHGSIALEEKGMNGFGYDSVFTPQGFSCTLAELTSQEKNHISHRKKALDAFIAYHQSMHPHLYAPI